METQRIETRPALGSIRTILSSRKISGRELARQLTVTPVYISRRLSGEVELSESDLINIAQVLGVTAGSFFPEQAAQDSSTTLVEDPQTVPRSES